MDRTRVLGVVEKTTDPIESYPTKEDLIAMLNKELITVMVNNGSLPAGSKVVNVRVRDVQLLIELPDGRKIDGALLIQHPNEDEGPPPSYFAPPGHGHA